MTALVVCRSRTAVEACGFALVLAFSACGRFPSPATPAPSATPAPFAQSASSAPQAVVAERLFFGRNVPGGGTVSDSAWSTFLAEVVTPRLPAGFTVFRTEGQWRDAAGAIVREASFVLEVEHATGQPPDSVFAAIAMEYCRRFEQEAVLHVRSAAQQWLYRAKTP